MKTIIFCLSAFLTCSLFVYSCTPAVIIGGKVEQDQLKDGIYEGSFKHGPNSATVKVTIKNSKILDVEILKHDAWKGKKADPIIPRRIVDAQSTDVDVVTGATNSSRVIMNAVQNAIDQAYLSEKS